MQPVLTFASNNMNNPDWKKRYSSLIALGAITEGPDRQTFINVIIPGLANLITKFEDPSIKVREAISWVIRKICEHHSEVFTND